MKHIYPAFFYNEGNGYSVLFPDFDCGTCGETLEQAYDMAVDFLYSQITAAQDSGQKLPKPSDIKSIEPATDFEYESVFSTLVPVDIEAYGKYLASKTKAVRKNVTIPLWLAEKADTGHLNYSSVLQEALKQKLNVG